MNIILLLNSALAHYSDDYKPLINHLKKFSNQIELSNEIEYMPLLILKEREIYLWIKDDNVSNFPFLFTDPEEILFVLYQQLSNGNQLYISKEIPLEFDLVQINEKINECLEKDDKEGFKKWIEIMKDK